MPSFGLQKKVRQNFVADIRHIKKRATKRLSGDVCVPANCKALCESMGRNESPEIKATMMKLVQVDENHIE